MSRFCQIIGLFLATAASVQAQNEALKEAALAGSDRSHWAFRKPTRPAVSVPGAPGWCRNPIDNFILARLEKDGLKPSSPATRTGLLRRVTFDLTGLPPTPEDIDEFVRDPRPDAYARVVERLLA